MSVCYGFTIEIYGFTHSLRTSLAHAAYDSITMENEVKDSDRRWQNESRCMEDGYLLNKRMKDNKIMVERNNLHISTRAIYFGDP